MDSLHLLTYSLLFSLLMDDSGERTCGADSGSTKGMPTFASINSMNKFKWSELQFIFWLVEYRSLGTTVVIIVSCNTHAEMWRLFRLGETISSESPILWFWQEIQKVSVKGQLSASIGS